MALTKANKMNKNKILNINQKGVGIKDSASISTGESQPPKIE